LIVEIDEACDLESRLEVTGSMRVEILANGKQRRHWSLEDRTRILADASATGAKVSDVARKHAIAPSLIFAWRREARAKELGESETPVLAPVHVMPRPTAALQRALAEEPPRLARSAAKKTGMIEIDLGDGKRVRVDTDADADALGRVLDVLERR
jgi:transposase